MSSELREHYLDRMRDTLAGITRCPHGVVRDTTACHACEVAVKAAAHEDPSHNPPEPQDPEMTQPESDQIEEASDG